MVKSVGHEEQIKKIDNPTYCSDVIDDKLF